MHLKLSPRFDRIRDAFAAVAIAGACLAPVGASAADGMVVVIANSYQGFLPGALRDANAVADKLEADGFDSVRLLDTAGSDMAAGLEKIRSVGEGAGPVRLVYMTGFGMCLSDDLMVFAEDMDPDQFKTGEVGDFVVPVSVVAEAAAEGADRTLVVFDTNPRQCTEGDLKAVTLPANTALLVTTGIGGDIVDEIDEGGTSAFATAFSNGFASGGDLQAFVGEIVGRIEALTDGQQKPILIGEF